MTITILEHESYSYQSRTKVNADIGDVTLAFAFDLETAGERLTKACAKTKYFGVVLNHKNIFDDEFISDVIRSLYKFIRDRKINPNVVNVAGNGMYTLHKFGVSQEDINHFVYKIIKKFHSLFANSEYRTGGQTGVDFGCMVACNVLNLKCTGLFPLGYRQRTLEKVEIYNTQFQIEQKLEFYSDKLKSMV